MEECIFCKLAKGEIPSYTIYEDEIVKVFLDINPVAKGHTLVIPKKHSRWVWDMDEEEYLEMMGRVHIIADALRKAFDTEWIEEAVIGMDVHHSHIQLIPRKKDDGLGALPTTPLDPKPSEEELKEILETVKDSLSDDEDEEDDED